MPVDNTPRVGDTTAAHLDRLLALAQRDGRLPSVTAAVVRGGETIWTGAAGTLDGRADGPPSDDDVQYRMGSLTKPFVAVAVMQLRDAGRLDLADRFEDHVPGSRLGAATVEQLLTHAAGVQAESNGPWWERTPGGDWTALASGDDGAAQRFRGGRRFHYSNTGFAALGRLVEVLHGRPWDDVVRTEILEPLAMARTTTRPTGRSAPGWAVHPFADVLLPEPEHDGGAMAPAGQLWSTARDLARWTAFLGGDTHGVVDTATLAEMCEPHHVADDAGAPWTMAMGLGFQQWNVDGARLAGHGGSMPGFLAGMRVRLDAGPGRTAAPGDGAVVLTNTTSSPAMRNLPTDLLTALAEHEPAPVAPWSAAGDPGLLELLGSWHWGPTTTTASARDGHLLLGEPGTGRGSRFAPDGDDRWVGLDGYHQGEPLQVIRREDGTVAHLDLQTFRFTRTPYAADGDVPGGVDVAGWR
ncbi:serine hydrolase domain-containing protein [Paraoerskovia marina]|uniref:serine hydrolase domain-containing protein n=1 Tax=Paraoerskovia marina TaxID=545619 RepID=UPI001E2D3CF7|nr:serine hydrolase domain-containing protein [Paraoerskovia marina]